MREYLKVLKYRDFRLLWLGRGISDLGSRINFIGITWLILETSGKVSSVSLLFILLIIPSIMLGPLAGVFVERWNKKTVIILADSIRGILAFCMAFANQIELIYTLAILDSLCAIFFSPTIRIIIPRLIPKDELVTSNSLSSITYYMAELIGPAISGVLIGLLGARSAFIINGISFLLAALFETSITIPKTMTEVYVNSKGYLFKEFNEGWNYVRGNKTVKFVIVFFALAMLPMGGLPILNVVLIKEIYLFSPQSYGLLMSINGIGLLIGTLYLGKWGRTLHELKLMVLGVIFYGLSYIGIALGGIFMAEALCFATMGFSASIINISYTTYLQKTVEDDKRGRVFSLDMAIGNVSGLISMGLVGITADKFGGVFVAVLGGVLIFILGTLTLKTNIYRESLKNM